MGADTDTALPTNGTSAVPPPFPTVPAPQPNTNSTPAVPTTGVSDPSSNEDPSGLEVPPFTPDDVNTGGDNPSLGEDLPMFQNPPSTVDENGDEQQPNSEKSGSNSLSGGNHPFVVIIIAVVSTTFLL